MVRQPELPLRFGIFRSLKRDLTGSFDLACSSVNQQVGYLEAGPVRSLAELFASDDWNTFRIGDKDNASKNGDRIALTRRSEQVTMYCPTLGAYWFRPGEHARGGMPRTMRWPR